MTTGEPDRAVNGHYLDHVAAAAAVHEVSAGEDIVNAGGIKLLAKGARIDSRVRDRLLQQKLRKPLEDCVQVAGGIDATAFEPVARVLLDKHALIRALCSGTTGWSPAQALAELTLSPPMQSLLTIYDASQADRLPHMVGVALLATSLAHRMLPGAAGRQRQLALAALAHDVGELYIDPACLRRGRPLDTAQWRHIAAHPVIGARVLRELEGAGPAVADAVLLHHERLDGFGYPRSVSGEAFALDGQILAAAEWLMALIESGASPFLRASMAARLVPGEFDRALLDAVAAAGRGAPEAEVDLGNAPPLEQAVPRILHLDGTLRRFGQARPWIEQRIAESGPELRRVLMDGQQRVARIQASFSSTGLDTHDPHKLIGELGALRDPVVYAEIVTLVTELEWRMRELERALRLRAGVLGENEAGVVAALLARIDAPAVDQGDPPGG